MTAAGTLLQNQIADLVTNRIVWKPPVRTLATTNQVLVPPFDGLPIISGVQTEEGTDVLLTAQTDATLNGPWTVYEQGWKRRGDFDASDKVKIGSTWRVQKGTHAGQLWHLADATGAGAEIVLNVWELSIVNSANALGSPLEIETIIVDDQMTLTDGLVQVHDGFGFREPSYRFRTLTPDNTPVTIGTVTLPANCIGKLAMHVFARDQEAYGVFMFAAQLVFLTDASTINLGTPEPLMTTMAEGTQATADCTPSDSGLDLDFNVTSGSATHDVDWVVRVELASLEDSSAF